MRDETVDGPSIAVTNDYIYVSLYLTELFKICHFHCFIVTVGYIIYLILYFIYVLSIVY